MLLVRLERSRFLQMGERYNLLSTEITEKWTVREYREGLERGGSRSRGDELEVFLLLCVSIFPSAPKDDIAKQSVYFSLGRRL
jgi:hypothetical protein